MFSEKPAPGLKVKLIAFVIDGMLARLDHKSNRAKKDTEAVVPNIKLWVDENKDVVF